eukprot:SAG22_NODE_4923_length_1130_cov_1.962173_1_plen_66_part_00
MKHDIVAEAKAMQMAAVLDYLSAKTGDERFDGASHDLTATQQGSPRGRARRRSERHEPAVLSQPS